MYIITSSTDLQPKLIRYLYLEEDILLQQMSRLAFCTANGTPLDWSPKVGD